MKMLTDINHLFTKSIQRLILRLSKQLSILCAIGLLAGCASPGCCVATTQDSDGAIRYLIIGFGVVSIPKPPTQENIIATNMQAIGLVFSNQPGLKMSLGYSSSSLIAINSRTENAIVEVRACKIDDGISVSAITYPNHQETGACSHERLPQ
jgi:hypothetical protein